MRRNAASKALLWAEDNNQTFSEEKSNLIHFSKKRIDLPIVVGSIVIYPQSEIRLLGVIFDNKLSWIPHVTALLKRCTTKLHLIKIRCKKITQLNYSTRRLLFLGLLEPLISYGFIVWKKISKKNFSPIDSFFLITCRFITGAMKGTASRTCFHEAGLPPIRIRLNELIRAEKIKKQVSQSRKIFFERVCPFNGNLDNFILRYSPIAKISIKQVIKLSSSSQWIAFVDGSKKGPMVGAGVYYTNPETNSMQSQHWKLLNHHTIDDAEFFAIYMALLLASQSQWSSATIFTDSFSVFSRLKQFQQGKLPFINHKLVEINNSLRLLKRKIVIQWIPSHSNIYGNDMADKLAKEGAQKEQIQVHDLLAITSIIPPNFSHHKVDLQVKKNEIIKQWWNTPENIVSPVLSALAIPDDEIKTLHLNLNYRQSQILTWLRSYVMPLNLQKFKMKISDNPLCSLCNTQEEESPYHFLIKCPFWNNLRLQCYLDVHNKDYNHIITNNYRAAIDFVQKSNRFPSNRIR